mmetsp:Transcript_37993/g.88771  ORF Transcript_37993/g.88771 Transcript_37993/m.88771 type:complete len:207 (-) Transcript_37993:732-1352(-)
MGRRRSAFRPILVHIVHCLRDIEHGGDPMCSYRLEVRASCGRNALCFSSGPLLEHVHTEYQWFGALQQGHAGWDNSACCSSSLPWRSGPDRSSKASTSQRSAEESICNHLGSSDVHEPCLWNNCCAVPSIAKGASHGCARLCGCLQHCSRDVHWEAPHTLLRVLCGSVGQPLLVHGCAVPGWRCKGISGVRHGAFSSNVAVHAADD